MANFQMVGPIEAGRFAFNRCRRDGGMKKKITNAAKRFTRIRRCTRPRSIQSKRIARAPSSGILLFNRVNRARARCTRVRTINRAVCATPRPAHSPVPSRRVHVYDSPRTLARNTVVSRTRTRILLDLRYPSGIIISVYKKSRSLPGARTNSETCSNPERGAETFFLPPLRPRPHRRVGTRARRNPREAKNIIKKKKQPRTRSGARVGNKERKKERK